MNNNIKNLNNGRNHLPIKKVRVFEQANKFSIGFTGQKATKFVEAAKGTNLFFVIYTNDKGVRGYATIPLNIVINLQKQFEKSWKEHLSENLSQDDIALMPKDAKILFVLSPGDLVYIPKENEKIDFKHIDKKRIYRVVSFTGNSLFCIPSCTASIILNKVEYEAKNKMETTIDKQYFIKKVCLPIQIDRLGNIINISEQQ